MDFSVTSRVLPDVRALVTDTPLFAPDVTMVRHYLRYHTEDLVSSALLLPCNNNNIIIILF